jgi:hypothetical protein
MTTRIQRPLGKDIARHRAPVLSGLSVLLGLLLSVGAHEAVAGGSTPDWSAASTGETAQASVRHEDSRMWMTVGKRRFAITLTDNAAARAFVAQLPLTLEMSELNGNEKHGELPKALPTSSTTPGTIRSGDLMLYGSDTLVIFYVTFDSAYSYTRLGRVDDSSELAAALGPRGVRVVFSKE